MFHLPSTIGRLIPKSFKPPVVQQPERLAEHVEEALTSLTSLLECIMASEVTDDSTLKLQYAVRIFLSKFDTLEAAVRAKNAKPTVVSAYNFACLLNLVHTMETYGPLHNLWEGGPRGEGFL